MWRLAGSTATWRCRFLQASIQLSHPARGLGSIAFRDQPLREAALLEMEPTATANDTPLLLNECYTRGRDLIANYADQACAYGTRSVPLPSDELHVIACQLIARLFI